MDKHTFVEKIIIYRDNAQKYLTMVEKYGNIIYMVQLKLRNFILPICPLQKDSMKDEDYPRCSKHLKRQKNSVQIIR